MSSGNNITTVDEKEIEYFKSKCKTWWDENGELKLLHSSKGIKIELMKKGLLDAGLLDEENINSPLPLRGLKILDAGCGGGIFSETLAKLGADVTGIDAAKELIDLAVYHASLDEHLANLKYSFETIEEHSEKHPGGYDCVVCVEVIEHINDQDEFLKGCAQCLKPGGCMFVMTFNKTFLARIYGIWLSEYVFGAIPRGCHDFKKFISSEEVAKILEKYGCETKRVDGLIYTLTSRVWYTSSTNIHYILHAVKNPNL